MSKQDDQAVAQPEAPKLSSWHPAIVTGDMAQLGAHGANEDQPAAETAAKAKKTSKKASVSKSTNSKAKAAQSAKSAQAERQRAYRERLKEKGIKEIRLNVPEEHHDRLRDLSQRLIEGDPFINVAADKKSRLAMMVPGISLSIAALVFALLVGGVFGALGTNLMHGDSVEQGAQAVARLKQDLQTLTVEKQQLEKKLSFNQALMTGSEDLQKLSESVAQLSMAVTDIRTELRSADQSNLSLPSITTSTSLHATPPGPKFVPSEPAKPRKKKASKKPVSEDVAVVEPSRPAVGRTKGSVYLYRIGPGDDLKTISRKFGISLAELKKINGQLRAFPWRYGDMIIVPKPKNS